MFPSQSAAPAIATAAASNQPGKPQVAMARGQLRLAYGFLSPMRTSA